MDRDTHGIKVAATHPPKLVLKYRPVCPQASVRAVLTPAVSRPFGQDQLNRPAIQLRAAPEAEAMDVMVFVLAEAAAVEWIGRASGPSARAIRLADRLIEGPLIIAAMIAHGAADIGMTAMVDIAVDIETDIATAIGSAVDIVIITGTTGDITTATTITDTFMDLGRTDTEFRPLHSAS
jgi:hypothetical protein